jgi:Ca-activated chloride channel family protein
VYTILVGRGGRVPMPVKVQDPFTGQVVTRSMPVEVDVDPELLRRIADRTGGEFFQATDTNALRTIFERIDKLEKSEIKLTAFRRYRELYQPLVMAVGALLLLAGILWTTGLRVVPA